MSFALLTLKLHISLRSINTSQWHTRPTNFLYKTLNGPVQFCIETISLLAPFAMFT